MSARPIRTLLIANRGEIACRIAATAISMGLRVVGVFTEHDRGALHVRKVDAAALIPSYLDMPALIGAARRLGADAVHPGYGFLSENAAFASAVIDAGLTWVGPPPAAIAAMGSKTEARARMIARGVPVVPGTRGGDLDELRAAALEIGYPVLVKASAGGGGKGMAVVTAPAQLEDAIGEAKRLAAAAFGDDAVFLERYLSGARHVEVQILADAHGHTTHLWERECSVQRRHQKVIEEAPSPAFRGPEGEARRRALTADAVRAAEAVGYQSAGTVEFIVAEDGAHYFLEMNTRLQVEHPVTEAITGLDIVALQLAIAAGEPLPESLRSSPPPAQGWAMEARLYAEDPDNGYLPGAGPVLAWTPPQTRADAGVERGDSVGTHFDPMLAKIVAHGADREQARRRLVRALEDTVVLGLPTNRAHLIRTLEHPAFAAGALSTRFLDDHAAELGPVANPRQDQEAICAAVVTGFLERRSRRALAEIPAGWRNNPTRGQQITFSLNDLLIEVSYRQRGADLEIDGATVRIMREDPLLLEIDGVTAHLPVARDGQTLWVHHARATSRLVEQPDLPEPGLAKATGGGAILAPMPGRVVRVLVAPGQAVEAGDVLVVIEAMKMEQALRTALSGVVRQVIVAQGDQVDSGALLALVEADNG